MTKAQPISFLPCSEKTELEDTINRQRKMMEDMRKRELDAFVQVKTSCEMTEQIQLEKHEVTMLHFLLKFIKKLDSC